MKLVVVDTTVRGSLIGGAQTFLIKLLAGLKARGHDVRFIAGGTPNPSIAKALEMTGAALETHDLLSGKTVDDVYPGFARVMNDVSPDAYIVSVSPDIGWTVLPLLDPKIATLTIGHNDENTFYAPVKHYRKFLTRAIGVSDEICRKYTDECGVPPENVDWIPYGVETSATAPVTNSKGPLKLVFVGRFDNTQKRIADVVKIIKQLTEEGIDFTFDLVGDGEEMASVRSELAAEIESGRVVLHGWVDSAQVIEVMRRSEVFILASAYEGFCISLTEAIANGCCPIVTDIRSGNKQLVREAESGFIVDIGDIDGFIGRIKLLSEDRELLARMRTAAWETGREYGVDRMVDGYVACFERAVEDARTHPRTPDPAFPLMESCRSKYPLWLRRIKARVMAR